MDREVIFDSDINRINEEKMKHIRLMPSSIKLENYSNLVEILKQSTELESVLVYYEKGNPKFWENFFKIFKNDEKSFNIDPSKIILSGDFSEADFDIFKDIENLHLLNKDVKNIEELKKKFPNLKNIELIENNSRNIEEKDIGELGSLFETAKYMKELTLAYGLGEVSIKQYMENHELDDKFLLSSDGISLINLERADENFKEDFNLHINVNDLKRFDINHLIDSNVKITLIADDASKLSIQELEQYEKMGLNIESVSLYARENGEYQNKPYDLKTYCAVREKLDELVDGIDINLPEKEKFAEVYKRVCKNIIYDTPAAYPRNNAERDYKEKQLINCRNLKNGLLEGKCVCAGYADILKNALSLVGVESQYVSGNVFHKKMKLDNFDENNYDDDYTYVKNDSEVIFYEGHAWNKVKLDGVWYNADPTWDATQIRLGRNPTHCLKTDEQIKNTDKKSEFNGPECIQSVDDKEIDEIFNGKHIYIGNFKVPNIKDIWGTTREVLEVYVEIGRMIKSGVINLKEKITDKTKLLPSANTKEDNISSYEENNNSWDLKNWGIEKKSFSKETKDIVLKNGNNNERNETRKDNIER